MTDGERATSRAWLFARIDRLMAPGVRIYPRTRAALIQKREAYMENEQRVPSGPERGWIVRLLVQVGLERRAGQRAPAKADKSADHHPVVGTPSGLQGSRAPTPMPPWLVTGVGLPLRPPTRRQAASPS